MDSFDLYFASRAVVLEGSSDGHLVHKYLFWGVNSFIPSLIHLGV